MMAVMALLGALAWGGASVAPPAGGITSMATHDQRFETPGGPSGTREEAAMPYDPTRAAAESGAPAIAGAIERHAARLMAIDGVMGVAVGRTRIGDDAILVYLRDASVKRRVPAEIEGHPVETAVTGEIDAYGRGR
jgi:hypothetical protein